jgi:hypothetical protein
MMKNIRSVKIILELTYDQIFQKHKWLKSETHSFCRNFDNPNKIPWCYTEHSRGWDECYLPICGAVPDILITILTTTSITTQTITSTVTYEPTSIKTSTTTSMTTPKITSKVTYKPTFITTSTTTFITTPTTNFYNNFDDNIYNNTNNHFDSYL